MTDQLDESLRSRNIEKEDQAVSKERSITKVNRVFVVLNPVAGLTDANDAKDLITQFCEENGWTCDLHETVKDEDLRQLVCDRIKEGIDLVIAAGGDGTVAAVVAGLANSSVPMGILPAGTGNALARDLQIPLDMQAALDLLTGPNEVRLMDLMEVNQQFFVLNASVGISSQTMRKTARNEKRRFGMLAYLYRALGTIVTSHRYRFEATVDGKLYRFNASEVMIANSKLLGFQPEMRGVEIDPNDRRLDMFIVRAQGLRDYLGVLLGFVFRRPTDENANLNYLQIRDKAEINCELPLPAQADGEVIGNTPMQVRLVPDALRVIAPPPENTNK